MTFGNCLGEGLRHHHTQYQHGHFPKRQVRGVVCFVFFFCFCAATPVVVFVFFFFVFFSSLFFTNPQPPLILLRLGGFPRLNHFVPLSTTTTKWVKTLGFLLFCCSHALALARKQSAEKHDPHNGNHADAKSRGQTRKRARTKREQAPCGRRLGLHQ